MPKGKKNRAEKPISWRKTACWMILFLLIAAASVLAVAEQSKSFSIETFFALIAASNPIYISLAVASMLCFILFEGLAILMICRSLGYGHNLKQSWTYASADIYFSAITPSATGGQPACAWVMIRDGVSAGAATVALLINLVFYTLSILIIGVITFLFSAELFFCFSGISKILIIVGYFLLTALAFAFALLLFKPIIVYRAGAFMIKVLFKLKLVKNPETQLARLQTTMQQYGESSQLIFRNKATMLKVFALNFLQRFSQIAVTIFAYLAVGGDLSHVATVGYVQAYSIVGSNCVPVPGAMGVSDYLLLDGFGILMTGPASVNFELLARSISFYSMIVICGLTVLVNYLLTLKKTEEDIP